MPTTLPMTLIAPMKTDLPTSNKPNLQISKRLLAWYDQHGRHNLPWQSKEQSGLKTDGVYKVWLSEIMLQQTQVVTVIPYFERFVGCFPTIEALAAASQDEVLHNWTGLGYYARARNLHKAAQIITSEHHGHFPDDFDAVLALPGIGRSTAGAILAQAFGQRHAILDGNVKRVLARLHCVEGWPGNKQVENQLWEYAEAYTPQQRLADYTQAIMDLGATLCKRGKPDCAHCPLQAQCQAYTKGRQADFPTRKLKKTLPVKSTQMLMLFQQQTCLLEQRPPTGIWGSLWSFPECPTGQNPAQFAKTQFNLKLENCIRLPTLRHTFSHFHLDIEPVLAQVSQLADRVMDSEALVWYNTHSPDNRGLPAPVVKLLKQVEI